MRTTSRIRAAAVSAIAIGACLTFPAHAGDAPKFLPAPAIDEPAADADRTETAVLAGGCFWGMQGVFEHVKGVTRVWAGYSGGSYATAQYEIVSTGMTGHAESVKIAFDPKLISYGEILRVYFSVAHDPTELDRQGPDTGRQYRSDIFAADDNQKRIATAYIAQLNAAHVFSALIVTRVDPFRAFFAAETYHQDFLVRNPDNPYIAYNDLPKIAALKQIYPTLYREAPVTLGAKS